MIAPDENGSEIRVLAAVDEAFAEARRRAGDWLVCHPGCDECCHRPFAITAQDGRRLRRGLETLPAADQAEIRERANEASLAMAEDFPGELATGALTESAEWREWFFSRHAGLPCPVLNRETGECRLYEYRPVACRLAGPLIQIGDSCTDPCRLCFEGVDEDRIKATIVVISLPEFALRRPGPDTIIAKILQK